jgi:hypothetical protein
LSFTKVLFSSSLSLSSTIHLPTWTAPPEQRRPRRWPAFGVGAAPPRCDIVPPACVFSLGTRLFPSLLLSLDLSLPKWCRAGGSPYGGRPPARYPNPYGGPAALRRLLHPHRLLISLPLSQCGICMVCCCSQRLVS